MLAKRVVNHLQERSFYLLSPIVQAVLIYGAFALILRLAQFPSYRLAVRTFTLFSFMSPFLNLFSTHWRRDTLLFILAWVALYLAINVTLSVVYPVAPGILTFSLPMLAAGLFLPVIALGRYLWNRSLAGFDAPDSDAERPTPQP